MLVVAVSGSPRKKGNSTRIVEKALAYFREKGIEAEGILLSETEVSPCVHCDRCKKENQCALDRQANDINDLLAKADAIIVASPVYFGGVSGQLKCLLDKTLPLRRNGFALKGKVGAAVASAGVRNGGQENAIRDIQNWMFIHGMMVVGDNRHFGGTVCGPLEGDTEGMETVEQTFAAVCDALLKR